MWRAMLVASRTAFLIGFETAKKSDAVGAFRPLHKLRHYPNLLLRAAAPRARWVRDLQLVRRPAGAVRRPEPIGRDALTAGCVTRRICHKARAPPKDFLAGR